jgi:hypothetical protein
MILYKSKGKGNMKTTYFVRSLVNNSISNRAVFRTLEMAMLKKKELEAKGDKIAIYRNTENGNSKRVA